MHYQRRAVLDGAAQVGRGRGVVDDQRQPGLFGHGGHGVEIGDVAARVGDGLAEDGAGVVVDGGADGVEIVEIHECR